MNRTKLTLCFLFFSLITLTKIESQNWTSAFRFNLPVHNNVNWLITDNFFKDKTGNLYFQGCSNNYSDTIGSFLLQFSESGNSTGTRKWNKSFQIWKIIYDGNQNLYFAGRFDSTLTIDGATITSFGGRDGVFGKMDLSGTILWMKTFGGPGEDGAYDLSLNSTGNSVYVCGQIKDTLYFNNTLNSINPQSAIICEYSFSGDLLRHKLYSFTSSKNYHQNCCVAIQSNAAGELVVLMDRNADRWWSNDPGTGPLVGRYLMKLNAALDTVWTTYANGPQSYYGWNCNKFKLNSAGDIYLLNEFSGKYGGDGQLSKYSGVTGKQTWVFHNSDGWYRDIFIDNSDVVFLTGIEGANGCPCEGNHPGYTVIKKISDDNSLLGETRTLNRIGNIISDNAGNLFATGTLGGRAAMVGDTLLKCDSTEYETGYFYHYGFIAKLSDINCTPPAINGEGLHPFAKYFCPWDSVSFTVTPSYVSYTWNNGISGNTMSTSVPGKYFVRTTEANGCVDYSLPFAIEKKKNDIAPVICMATFDLDSNKYKFYSYLNFDYSTSYYNVFKKKNSEDTVNINQLNYTNYTMYQFFDGQSSPYIDPGEYFLSFVDTCGSESPKSVGHRPIFLTITRQGSNNVLNWNPYKGFEHGKYFILRGTSLNNMLTLDSVNKETFTFTDVNAGDAYYYQIKVMKNWGCYIINSTVSVSSSNPARNSTLSSAESISLDFNAKVFPNPSAGKFTVRVDRTILQNNPKNVLFEVNNVIGEKVHSGIINSESYQMDISYLPKGTYFLTLKSGEETTVKRIMIGG
jgi:hypothetical protein